MKKSILLPLMITSLLLAGCNSSSKKKSSKGSTNQEAISSKETVSSTSTTSGVNPTSANPSVSSGTSVNPTSNNPSQTSQTPPGGEVFEGLFIKWYPETVKVGVLSSTPIVDIIYTEGHSGDEFDNPLTWDTSDHTIAEADQYGRVSAKQKGIITLTCTSVVDNKSASCTVVCYNNNSDFTKSWNRLGSTDTLKPGDQLIIACPQYNKAATSESVGSYLHATDVSYNTDKSVMTDTTGAAKFILGDDYKGREGYNLEVPELDKPYLAFTNEAKVHWENQPKKSNTLWSIEYDSSNGVWDMRTVTAGDGWMMYNKDIDGFAPYQSNETEMMKVMTPYRLTYTLN